MIAKYSSDLAVIFLINVDVLELVEEEVDLFLNVGVLWTDTDSPSALQRRPVEKVNNDQKNRSF